MKGKRTFSLSNINNNNNNTDLLPAEATMKPGPPQASPQVSPVCLCGGRPGQTTPDLSPTHSHIYSDKRVSCIEGLPLPAPAQLWVVCPGAASITEGVSEKCNTHSPCPPWYVWDRDGVPGREQVISQGLRNEQSCVSFFGLAAL